MQDEQTQSQASEAHDEATTEAGTPEDTKSNDGVDYQKELQMARDALAKKDKQINQAEHVIEKLKEEGKKVDTETIEKMVERMVEDRISNLTNQVRKDAIDGIINQYAATPDEADLIKFHLENSIKPSGDDVTDIINAKALANKARFSQQTSEIARAKSQTEPEQPSVAGEKQAKSEQQKFSASDLKIMRAFGVTKEDLDKK